MKQEFYSSERGDWKTSEEREKRMMTMTKKEREGAGQSECCSLSLSMKPADIEHIVVTGVCLSFVTQLGQNLQIIAIAR